MSDIYKLTLEVSAGSSIENMCKMMVRLRQQYKCVVEGKFNEVQLKTSYNSGQTAQDLNEVYWKESEKRRQTYLASPEYAASLRQRKQEVTIKQYAVDKLLADLENIPATACIKFAQWFGELARVADDVDVIFDKKLLLDRFAEMGYRISEHVGKSPDWFVGRPSQRAIYIIGQALSNLSKGLPPHPVLEKFVKEMEAELC